MSRCKLPVRLQLLKYGLRFPRSSSAVVPGSKSRRSAWLDFKGRQDGVERPNTRLLGDAP
eukprot:6196628-Pleurochrysis_carterae.AAC.4